MSKVSIVILILVAIIVGVWYFYPGALRTTKNPSETDIAEEMTSAENAQVFTRDTGISIGEANRIFKEEQYTLGVHIEKIADPKKGRYEGWLLNRNENKQIYLGPFTKLNEGDYKDHYVLGYQSREDLRIYKDIIITLEAVDDQNPEKEIAGAVFP